MDIDYLYSIVNLYLKKEDNNKKTVLNIKKIDDELEFSFYMKKDNEDKTTFMVPCDIVNNRLSEFINMYKEELMIIDEKFNYDNVTSTCYYYVLFNTGRVISFNGFSMLELNNIRNILYNININKEEMRVEEIDEKKEMAYQPRLRLQQAGFSSYATLFMVVVFFVIVLVIALFIFNSIFS